MLFEGLPTVVRGPIELVVFGGDLPRADVSGMRWMAAELRAKAAAMNDHAEDAKEILAQEDSLGALGDRVREMLHLHHEGAARLREEALALADQAHAAANDAEKTLCVMFAFGVELAWRIIATLSAAAAAGPAGELAAAPVVESMLIEGRGKVALMRAGLEQAYKVSAANTATRLSALGPYRFAITVGTAAALPASVDLGAQLMQVASGDRNPTVKGPNGENPRGIDLLSIEAAAVSGAGGAVGGIAAGVLAPKILPRLETSRSALGLVQGVAGAVSGLGAAALITGWPEHFEDVLASLLSGGFAGVVDVHGRAHPDLGGSPIGEVVDGSGAYIPPDPSTVSLSKDAVMRLAGAPQGTKSLMPVPVDSNGGADAQPANSAAPGHAMDAGASQPGDIPVSSAPPGATGDGQHEPDESGDPARHFTDSGSGEPASVPDEHANRPASVDGQPGEPSAGQGGDRAAADHAGDRESEVDLPAGSDEPSGGGAQAGGDAPGGNGAAQTGAPARAGDAPGDGAHDGGAVHDGDGNAQTGDGGQDGSGGDAPADSGQAGGGGHGGDGGNAEAGGHGVGGAEAGGAAAGAVLSAADGDHSGSQPRQSADHAEADAHAAGGNRSARAPVGDGAGPESAIARPGQGPAKVDPPVEAGNAPARHGAGGEGPARVTAPKPADAPPTLERPAVAHSEDALPTDARPPVHAGPDHPAAELAQELAMLPSADPATKQDLTAEQQAQFKAAAKKALALYRLRHEELAGESWEQRRNTMEQGDRVESLLRYIDAMREGTGKTPRWNQVKAFLLGEHGFMRQMGTGQGKSMVGALDTLRQLSRGEPVETASGKPVRVHHVITTTEVLANEGVREFAPMLRSLGYEVARWDPHNPPGDAERPTVYYMTYDERATAELFDRPPPGKTATIDEADAVLVHNQTVHYQSEGQREQASEVEAAGVYRVRDFLKAVLRSRITAAKDLSVHLEEAFHEGPLTADEAGAVRALSAEEFAAARTLTARSLREQPEQSLATVSRLWERYAGRKFTAEETEMARAFLDVKAGRLKLNRDFQIFGTDSEKKVQILDEYGKPRSDPKIGTESRWFGGRHKMVEAMFDAPVYSDGTGSKQVTVEDVFGGYEHLHLMSGTLERTAAEIKENFPVQGGLAKVEDFGRSKLVGEEDRIFLTQPEKLRDAVDRVRQLQAEGRPVLVICPFNDLARNFSLMLTKADVEHHAIDARWFAEHRDNNAAEEHLLSVKDTAGARGTVTVGTGMLGRGFDVSISDEVDRLGGVHAHMLGRSPTNPDEDHQWSARAGRNGRNGSFCFNVAASDRLYSEAQQHGARVAVTHYRAAVAEHAEASAEYTEAARQAGDKDAAQPTEVVQAARAKMAATAADVAAAEREMRSLTSPLQNDAADRTYLERAMRRADQAHGPPTAGVPTAPSATSPQTASALGFLDAGPGIAHPAAALGQAGADAGRTRSDTGHAGSDVDRAAAETVHFGPDAVQPHLRGDRFARLAGWLGIPVSVQAAAAAFDTDDDDDPLSRLLERAGVSSAAVEALNQHLDHAPPAAVLQSNALSDEQVLNHLTPQRNRLAAELGWDPAQVAAAEGVRQVGAALGTAREELAALLDVPVGEVNAATARDVLAETVGRLLAPTETADDPSTELLVLAASTYLAVSALLDLTVAIHQRSPKSCVNNGVTMMRVLYPDNEHAYHMPDDQPLRGHDAEDTERAFGGAFRAFGSLNKAAAALEERPGGSQALVYRWMNKGQVESHLVLLVNDSDRADAPNLVVLDIAAAAGEAPISPADLAEPRALLHKAVPFEQWQREQQPFIDQLDEADRDVFAIEFDSMGQPVARLSTTQRPVVSDRGPGSSSPSLWSSRAPPLRRDQFGLAGHRTPRDDQPPDSIRAAMPTPEIQRGPEAVPQSGRHVVPVGSESERIATLPEFTPAVTAAVRSLLPDISATTTADSDAAGHRPTGSDRIDGYIGSRPPEESGSDDVVSAGPDFQDLVLAGRSSGTAERSLVEEAPGVRVEAVTFGNGTRVFAETYADPVAALEQVLQRKVAAIMDAPVGRTCLILEDDTVYREITPGQPGDSLQAPVRGILDSRSAGRLGLFDAVTRTNRAARDWSVGPDNEVRGGRAPSAIDATPAGVFAAMFVRQIDDREVWQHHGMPRSELSAIRERVAYLQSWISDLPIPNQYKPALHQIHGRYMDALAEVEWRAVRTPGEISHRAGLDVEARAKARLVEAFVLDYPHITIVGFDHPDVPAHVVEEILGTLDEMLTRFPGRTNIRGLWIDYLGNEMAGAASFAQRDSESTFRTVGIQFSLRNASRPAWTVERGIEMRERGFNPIGDRPFHHDAVHEFVHAIDAVELLSPRLRQVLDETWSRLHELGLIRESEQTWLARLPVYAFADETKAQLRAHEALAVGFAETDIHGAAVGTPQWAIHEYVTTGQPPRITPDLDVGSPAQRNRLGSRPDTGNHGFIGSRPPERTPEPLDSWPTGFTSDVRALNEAVRAGRGPLRGEHFPVPGLRMRSNDPGRNAALRVFSLWQAYVANRGLGKLVSRWDPKVTPAVRRRVLAELYFWISQQRYLRQVWAVGRDPSVVGEHGESHPDYFRTRLGDDAPNMDMVGHMPGLRAGVRRDPWTGKWHGGVGTPAFWTTLAIGRIVRSRMDAEASGSTVLQNIVELPGGARVDGNVLCALERGRFAIETARADDQRTIFDAALAELAAALDQRSPELSGEVLRRLANAVYLLFQAPLMTRGSDATIRTFAATVFTFAFGLPLRLPHDIDLQAMSRRQSDFVEWFTGVLDRGVRRGGQSDAADRPDARRTGEEGRPAGFIGSRPREQPDPSLDASRGAWLKALRLEQGMKQKDVARAAGLTNAALSNIENGRRTSLGTFQQICRVLGVGGSALTEATRRFYPDVELETDAAAHDSPGGWIAGHRNARGMTKADLARAVGVSPTRIGEIENGDRPPPNLFFRIARTLEVGQQALAEATRDLYPDLVLDLDPNAHDPASPGRWIVALRHDRDVTQAEVARTAGTSAGYLAGIEGGEYTPTSIIFRRICRALEVAPELLGTATHHFYPDLELDLTPDTHDPASPGSWIVALRHDRDMTRTDLAKAIGPGWGHLGHIETGNYVPRFAVFRRICEVLRIDDELLRVAAGHFYPYTDLDLEPPAQDLGRWITALRHDRDMSRAELARVTGLSTKYLAQVETENRRPRYGTFRRICRGLGVSGGPLIQAVRDFYSDITADIDPAAHRSLGRWIAALRFDEEMSTTELARRMQIPRRSLSDIENDRYLPRLRRLRQLCRAHSVGGELLLEIVERFYADRYERSGYRDEEELFQRYTVTRVGSPEERAAQNEISERFAWVPKAVARREAPDIRDEAVQAAWIGMLSAIANHIPSASFAAHAWASCRAAVFRYRLALRFPDLDNRTQKLVSTVEAQIRRMDSAGAALEDAEIARQAGLTVPDVALAREILARPVLRLGTPIGGNNGSPHRDVADPVPAGFSDTDFTETVRSALADMADPATAERLVMLHLVEGKSLARTAERLGLPAATAADVLADAVVRLRGAFDHREPTDVSAGEQNRVTPWSKARAEPDQPPTPSVPRDESAPGEGTTRPGGFIGARPPEPGEFARRPASEQTPGTTPWSRSSDTDAHDVVGGEGQTAELFTAGTAESHVVTAPPRVVEFSLGHFGGYIGSRPEDSSDSEPPALAPQEKSAPSADPAALPPSGPDEGRRAQRGAGAVPKRLPTEESAAAAPAGSAPSAVWPTPNGAEPFRRWLKAARLARGLTQAQLATRIGVPSSATYIGSLERGVTITRDMAVRLLDGLGVPDEVAEAVLRAYFPDADVALPDPRSDRLRHPKDWIIAARTSRGMSRAELAARAGVGLTGLSQKERAENPRGESAISPEYALRLLAGLDASSDIAAEFMSRFYLGWEAEAADEPRSTRPGGFIGSRPADDALGEQGRAGADAHDDLTGPVEARTGLPIYTPPDAETRMRAERVLREHSGDGASRPRSSPWTP
ncbi:helix-turn-helix domain-containing protein [Nocardia sp. NPDC057455]|uniref:helix-turn-helix domain-containing protein n=1 Tax=Nocardia sp. NPDC057455 TaxID=3346138 RepID=UPI00366DEAA6